MRQGERLDRMYVKYEAAVTENEVLKARILELEEKVKMYQSNLGH